MEAGGETCPHEGVAEQDTVQLTPLESFATVALMEAAAPPSIVCGEGWDTLTEIGGVLPPQPASAAARRNATPREGPRSNPSIKPPDEMRKGTQDSTRSLIRDFYFDSRPPDTLHPTLSACNAPARQVADPNPKILGGLPFRGLKGWAVPLLSHGARGT